MRKKPSKKVENLFFVYDHPYAKNMEYSHPILRIMQIDPAYPLCTPDTLLEFTSQCDARNGFSFANAYALKCELNLDSYRSVTSIKFLNLLYGLYGKEGGFSHMRSMRQLVKTLRSLGMPRYVLATVHSEAGYDKKEFIPREFKNKAKLYWTALQEGCDLKRKGKK